ncbi:hypothetical protein [Winogradskyella sp.]|uniref:hypothetical protein n=1 Tax=Winogradskyella sp. TaxID=1883156 RepID=UPI003BAAFE07
MAKKIILILLCVAIIGCSDDSDSEPENLNCPNTTDPNNFDDFYFGPIADDETIELLNFETEYLPVSNENPDDSFGKYYQVRAQIQNKSETELTGKMYFVLNAGGERHIVSNGNVCSSLMPNEICEFDFSITRNLDYIEDPNPSLICAFYQLIEN